MRKDEGFKHFDMFIYFNILPEAIKIDFTENPSMTPSLVGSIHLAHIRESEVFDKTIFFRRGCQDREDIGSYMFSGTGCLCDQETIIFATIRLSLVKVITFKRKNVLIEDTAGIRIILIIWIIWVVTSVKNGEQ
uniref:Uncharacterized protein n=1 Tax=Glossina austeni TaxID=7395 RepID=A0A1A9V4F6_GLOAU